MSKKAFKITRRRDGVFLTDETSTTRVADPIRVRSIGTRWSDKVTLVEIRFKTIHGDYRSEMFEFSYLQPERRTEIKVRVGDQGYRWPEDRAVSNELLRQLAAKQPKCRFFLVSAPGWYETEFVLPGVVFSSRKPKTDYRIDPGSDAHIGPFVCAKGSLKGWQETVAKPAKKSSCLGVAIAASFRGSSASTNEHGFVRDQLVQHHVGRQDSHALYCSVRGRSDRPWWFARMGKLRTRNGGSGPRSS